MRRKWENAENSEREKHTFCCVLPPVTQFRSELEAKRISLHESKFALLCKSDSVKGKKRKKTSSSSLQVLLLKQEMGFSLRSLLGTWGRQKREKALNSNKIYSDHKFTVDYRKRVAESEWNGIRRKKAHKLNCRNWIVFLKRSRKERKFPCGNWKFVVLFSERGFTCFEWVYQMFKFTVTMSEQLRPENFTCHSSFGSAEWKLFSQHFPIFLCLFDFSALFFNLFPILDQFNYFSDAFTCLWWKQEAPRGWRRKTIFISFAIFFRFLKLKRGQVS